MSFDIEEAVSKIHVPVIIVAGEADKICLPEDVRSIFEKANEPKKYVLLPGIGHDYRRSSSQIEIVNREIVKTMESF